MSIFKNIDFSEAHGMVICCVTNYLIEGVQKLEQKVNYSNYVCMCRYI